MSIVDNYVNKTTNFPMLSFVDIHMSFVDIYVNKSLNKLRFLKN
jgi:hypothetical protein